MSDNTPATTSITDAGATLGLVLFYDTRLSANDTTSCSSSLESVIDHNSRNFKPHPNLDFRMRPLNFTDSERRRCSRS